MYFFFNRGDEAQSLKEWALVEVQGDLESSTGDSIAGKLIGHLIFTSKVIIILLCYFFQVHIDIFSEYSF